MEFDKVISLRRSIRKYKQRQIPDKLIYELLEAARLAPSGLNLQPWRYVMVKDKVKIDSIAKAIPSEVAAAAPLLIICCVDTTVFDSMGIRIKELCEAGAFNPAQVQYFAEEGGTENKLNEFMLRASMAFNAAIAIEHIALEAVDLGLGSCWLQPVKFDKEKVREIIDLENSYDILAFMSAGYADEQPEARPRLSADKLLLKVI